MNQTVETVISSLKTIYAQNGLSSVPFKGNDRDLVYEGMRAVQKKKKKKKERKKERLLMVKSHQPALLWHHFYYHACDFIAKTNDCGCFRCCTACIDLPLTLSLPLFSSPLSLSLSLSLSLRHTHTHPRKQARTHTLRGAQVSAVRIRAYGEGFSALFWAGAGV